MHETIWQLDCRLGFNPRQFGFAKVHMLNHYAVFPLQISTCPDKHSKSPEKLDLLSSFYKKDTEAQQD